MQPFKTITGAAVPLLQANVDTDVIVRIERLTGNADLGHYAFEALRYLPDGSANPGCVFNQPRFAKAPILLAGRNFGCGSSREGAVTALMAMGISCVIAPSFGDIFSNNSFKNGLLPVVLSAETCARLRDQLRAKRGAMLTVDLERQSISASGEVFHFPVDTLQREGLLEGLDEIGLTLKATAEIAAWQSMDRAHRPWVWLTEKVEM